MQTLISFETLRDIHDHVDHARIKHPWPDNLPDSEKYRIVEHELHEMAAAMIKQDRRGVRKEALDAIAALIRIVDNDGDCEGA